jgi:hypothetical protein
VSAALKGQPNTVEDVAGLEYFGIRLTEENHIHVESDGRSVNV